MHNCPGWTRDRCSFELKIVFRRLRNLLMPTFRKPKKCTKIEIYLDSASRRRVSATTEIMATGFTRRCYEVLTSLVPRRGSTPGSSPCRGAESCWDHR